MAQTPQKVSNKIDEVIDQLNAKWDLELPRLYGPEAQEALNEAVSVGRRCSSRIRFLCYRSNVAIDKIISDFEEVAKVMYSSWVWKPSQERGTIPSIPADKSFLKRDIVLGATRPSINAAIRKQLVSKLSSLLDDEVNLVHDSDSYQRTTPQKISGPRSTSTSFSDAKRSPQRQRSPSKMTQSLSTNPLVPTTPTKRRKGFDETAAMETNHKPLLYDTSDCSQDGKRLKIDLSRPRSHIGGFFGKSKVTNSTSSRPDFAKQTSDQSRKPDDDTSMERAPLCDVFTSFETAGSTQPSVFSSVDDTRSISSSSSASIILDEEESQNYFPTQDANECLADVSFTSMLDDADIQQPIIASTLDTLNVSSPFKSAQSLPAEMPFWMRWETYRIANSTNLSPSFLHKALQPDKNNAFLSYDNFWTAAKIVCSSRNKILPSKSDIRSWMVENNTYESQTGRTAYFTLNLTYGDGFPHLWKLELNPIRVDIANRIHRRYGPDRHITAYLPYFDENSLPKWLTKQKGFEKEAVFEHIVKWLVRETHHIAGRQWRVFYLEPEKKSTRRKGDIPRLKLNLFAVDGADFGKSAHNPVTLNQFMNWHIAMADNMHSTELKLFSRFGLGLSKTKATVVLLPEQFRYLQDHELVMNDGCALISVGLARSIWSVCGDGGNDVPSAFQGRCGGAKGLWISDYRSGELHSSQEQWMEISDSQLKIKPHPKDRWNADDTQRTFEVLKWSKPCNRGHLNIQLINILADRGVPRAVLQQIVLDDLQEYIEASRAALKDPRQLQAWLQDYHSIDHQEEPVSFEDGLPEGKEQEVYFLVQSGFTAENCRHLREAVIQLMTQRLNTYVEKLRIEVPDSTSIFCVPDPYQVLEEDEVYLGFSNHWENPRTGLKEVALNDIEVLVARNPAALASDIQKRKAVYKHELRHFKDVIIFSTKGSVPLASLLSGGDYDGDTVTVLWNPQLVDNFTEVSKPILPTEEQCGLEKVSRKLSSFIDPSVTDAGVEEFLISSLSFNAQPSRLGMCTSEHERLIYNGVRLSDPGAVMLAALAGYLVDANKQGLAQTHISWCRIRAAATGGRRLLPLAYKSGDDQPRRLENGQCVNVIDYLKFDVAMKHKEDVLVEFDKLLPNAQNYDRDLALPFRTEEKRAADKSHNESKAISAILASLKSELNKVLDVWLRIVQQRENDLVREKLRIPIRQISSLIRNIQPLKADCDIYYDYIREQQNMQTIMTSCEGKHLNFEKGTRWSLLRASTMYALFHKRRITWWTIGDELCRIKARCLGPTRELVPIMHHVLKPDGKLIKRLAADMLRSDEEPDNDLDD